MLFFLYTLYVYIYIPLLGCPPLQGSEKDQQNFMGVLETAMKIANQDEDAEDEEEDGPREAAKVNKKLKLALTNGEIAVMQPRTIDCLPFKCIFP